MRLLALLLGLLPAAAAAQTYDVTLGGRTMGMLTTTSTTLESVLDNTPLGLADGRFAAIVEDRGAGQLAYDSRSDKRNIAFTTVAGYVTEVAISPEDERTDLSDPAAVGLWVQDPVTVMARLAQATDCPPPMRLYDGRRVTEMSVTGRREAEGRVTCDIAYSVVRGPGHLSPFRLSRIALEVVYDGTGMAELTASAGGFDLGLVRK